MEFQQKFKARTKNIGVETIKLVDRLPQKPSSWILAKQIIRSSTSIGANYRAACRGKSTVDFLNKLKIVEEETDETVYWLEVMQEAGLISETDSKKLLPETKEVLAIVITSIKTTRERYPKS